MVLQQYNKGVMETKQLEELFSKVPELKLCREVYLARNFFAALNDESFIMLWHMPGLRIRVSAKTMEYIEERRNRLGLKKTTHAKVQ